MLCIGCRNWYHIYSWFYASCLQNNKKHVYLLRYTKYCFQLCMYVNSWWYILHWFPRDFKQSHTHDYKMFCLNGISHREHSRPFINCSKFDTSVFRFQILRKSPNLIRERCHRISSRTPIRGIKWSCDCQILIMVFPIVPRQHFYIETCACAIWTLDCMKTDYIIYTFTYYHWSGRCDQ